MYFNIHKKKKKKNQNCFIIVYDAVTGTEEYLESFCFSKYLEKNACYSPRAMDEETSVCYRSRSTEMKQKLLKVKNQIECIVR